MSKRLVVPVEPEFHKVLKLYAAFSGSTMTQVVMDALLLYLRKHAQMSDEVLNLLRDANIEYDPRMRQECWGPLCRGCRVYTICATANGVFRYIPAKPGTN